MMNTFPHHLIDGGVTAPLSYVANALSCGIKNPEATRLDLALLYSTEPTISSATFTINRVRAACVRVSEQNLAVSNFRAIISNSGNANACTGQRGMLDAQSECDDVAAQLGLDPKEVAVCSTGVIGLPMPMLRISPRIPELCSDLSPDKGGDVAAAIMTSDTRKKEIALEIQIAGKPVRIGACCKGAGMISPTMATMICLVTTDAAVDRASLDATTLKGVESSFNCVTIDGDMSTNDTCIVMANGASGVQLSPASEGWDLFEAALHYVMLDMAKHIVQDGERVTKFVTVRVQGAAAAQDAKLVAEAVAKSALVKSSWNGNDPNWGRIIHAVGYAGAPIVEELIDIDIAGLPACRHGEQTDTPSDVLREAVIAREFEVLINLNQGDHAHTVYTTDLSPEYVDFNRSEYAYWNQAKKDGLTK